MSSRNLEWNFDGEGMWESISPLHDDGSHFVWRINISADGIFSISESDSELVGNIRDKLPTFKELEQAKHWCEMQNSIDIASIMDNIDNL